MAIKRNIEHYQSQTQKSVIKLTYTLPSISPTKSDDLDKPTKEKLDQFGYPVKLIYQDIGKTLLISMITIGILIFLTLKTGIL